MKPHYIYAFDPTVNRRVVHVVKGGKAISMVTGNNFGYKPKPCKCKYIRQPI